MQTAIALSTLTSQVNPSAVFHIYRDRKNPEVKFRSKYRIRTPEGGVKKPFFNSVGEAEDYIRRTQKRHFPPARDES